MNIVEVKAYKPANPETQTIKYKHIKKIGSGAFGTVTMSSIYEDGNVESEVAIKKVLQDPKFKVN